VVTKGDRALFKVDERPLWQRFGADAIVRERRGRLHGFGGSAAGTAGKPDGGQPRPAATGPKDKRAS